MTHPSTTEPFHRSSQRRLAFIAIWSGAVPASARTAPDQLRRLARDPSVGNENDAKPVGIDERNSVCLPVRICRIDRLAADTVACLINCFRAAKVENEQGHWVLGGAAV